MSLFKLKKNVFRKKNTKKISSNQKYLVSIAGFALTLLVFLLVFQYYAFDTNTHQERQRLAKVYQDFNNDTLVDEKTNEVVGFLKNKNGLDPTFFGSDEISHLEDVKKIFRTTTYITYALIILIAFLFYKIHEQKEKKLLYYYTFLVSAYSGMALILIGSINFFFLFDLMHAVLFPQGNYAFNPAVSNMIRLFPVMFFFGIFSKILTMLLYFLILFLITARIINKKNKGFF
ncbi:DUF1461 domain-containing protein [Candidatus Woesearchaeota archaeon]|nr:DUF1461 domain-containing protein [Candidatus Woesearchaeota archaeon]